MYYPQPPMTMPRPMAAPPMAAPPMAAPPMAAPPTGAPPTGAPPTSAPPPKSSGGGVIILFLLVILLVGAIAGYFFLQSGDKKADQCNGHKTSFNCNNDSNCNWDASSLTCKGSSSDSSSTPPSSTPLPPPTPPEEIVEVPGCTVPEANNYNPEATTEDDSCTFDPPPPDEIIVDTTPDKIFCRQDQKITCTSNPPQKVPDPESCLPNTDSLSVYCTSKSDESSCLEKVGYGGPLCKWDSSSNLCDIDENNSIVACNMIFKAGDPSKCFTGTDPDLSVMEKCEPILDDNGEPLSSLCNSVALGNPDSKEQCESIRSTDLTENGCIYTSPDHNPLCIYTPPPDPRCSCEDCPEGYKSSIDFVGDNKALNDRFAMSTECEIIPLGELKCSPGQRVKHPNDNGEENYSCSDGLCVCEDCPEETYGCPVNIQNKRDPTMQPSPDCQHEAEKVKDSSVTTKCYRRKCSSELTSEYTYEKMVRNGDIYSCEPCQVVNNIQYVSDGSEVSPDFALDDHLSECEISDSETDRFAGYCSSDSEFNESWSLSAYIEWSNRVYNDISNKSSWLPRHEELKKYSDKWCPECKKNYVITKNGIDKNMTNKDVYYGSITSVPNEFKYSYLDNNGQWVHLCDCKYDASDIQSSNNADKSNGFTNCKCAKSQYVDITSPISDRNNLNCNVIDSPCWKQGNYWYSPKANGVPPLFNQPEKFLNGKTYNNDYLYRARDLGCIDTIGSMTHGRNICKATCENTNGCNSYYTRDRKESNNKRRCCLKGFNDEDLNDLREGKGIVEVAGNNIGFLNNIVYPPSQLIPGAFWNIMDPYCSFLTGTDASGNFSLNNDDIIERCCVGCNHKVYKDGMVGDDNEYETSGTLPPSYANNWLDLVNVDAPGLSPIVFNKTDDPIFVPSSSLDEKDVHNMNKINLRKYDKSIGFNSRPVFYYPDFRHQNSGVSPDSLYANYNTVSDVDFHVSKNIINGAAEARHGGDTGSSDLENRKDPTCVNSGASQCSNEKNYNIMTKNIFTCNRTNPLPLINKSTNVLDNGGSDISLSQWNHFDTGQWDDSLRKYYIPPFTVVGDEQFYNVTATPEQKSMYLNNYDLEYPGRGWIPKNAVGIEFTDGMNKWKKTSSVWVGNGSKKPHETACRGFPGNQVGGSQYKNSTDAEKNNWSWDKAFAKNHGRKQDLYTFYVHTHDRDRDIFKGLCNVQKAYKYGRELTCHANTIWQGSNKSTNTCSPNIAGYNNLINRINSYQSEENKNYYNKEKTATPITEGPAN